METPSLVVALRGDSFFEQAQTLAASRSWQFRPFDTLSELKTFFTSTSDVIMLVASPRQIHEDLLYPLQIRLEKHGIYFAVLTGLHGNSLEKWMQSVSMPHFKRSCILLRKTDEELRTDTPNVVLLTRASATIAQLKDVSREDLLFFSAMIDGHSDRLFLTDGIISPESNDGNRNVDTLPVAALRAQHVFLDSCASSIVAGRGKEPDQNVALRLLEGARSLLAGYRAMEGAYQEAVLYANLAQSGYCLGEIHYLMNRNASAMPLKRYPYILFGNPWERVVQEEVATNRFTLDEVMSEDRHLIVDFRDIDALVVDTYVEAPPEIVEAAHHGRCVVTVDRDNSRTLFYTAFQDPRVPRQLRLILYSASRLRLSELRINVRPYAFDAGKERTIYESARNAQHLEMFRWVDARTRGQALNLANYAHHLVRSAARLRVDANERFAHKLQTAEKMVRTVGRGIIDNLSRRPSGFFLDSYSTQLPIHEVELTDKPCPHCTRMLFHQVRESDFRQRKRIATFCPRCVNVHDVPVGANGIIPAFPRLSGPRELYVGKEHSFILEFDNVLDYPVFVDLYVWPWANETSLREHFQVRPDRDSFYVEPNESVTLDCSVTVGISGRFALYGYVVASLDVYLTTRPIVVRAS